MESNEVSKQYAQNQFNNLHLIPFIKSTTEAEKTTYDSKRCATINAPIISGEEASEFYNSVISTPSTSKVQSASLPHKISRCKVKSVSTTQQNSPLKSSIFRYAQEGNLKGVESLLAEGCSINHQDMYGWTPLMCAAYEGHSCIVEYLVKSGSDLNIKNKMNMTALDIALQRGNPSVIKHLRNRVHKSFENVNVPKRDNTSKYCNTCHASYTGTLISHERSISHLFCCEKTGLSTFYHIPENNKGFQIMLKKGWDKGLGLNENGRKFPIKTVLKKTRACIGSSKEVPKVTHFGPNDSSSIRYTPSVVKMLREKTLKKRERSILEQKQRQKEINFRREFCDI